MSSSNEQNKPIPDWLLGAIESVHQGRVTFTELAQLACNSDIPEAAAAFLALNDRMAGIIPRAPITENKASEQ